MKTAEKQEQKQRLSRNEEKWTRTLMAAGWSAWPTVIMEFQDTLGLEPIDVNILLQLSGYWWFRENPARPSKRRIAKAMGINVSTLRKHIARMERDGLIRREKRNDPHTGGQGPNFYHFDGLIEICTPLAEQMIAARKQRQKDAEATRKKKRLALVPATDGGKS
jgi:predicted transcriptional regulator